MNQNSPTALTRVVSNRVIAAGGDSGSVQVVREDLVFCCSPAIAFYHLTKGSCVDFQICFWGLVGRCKYVAEKMIGNNIDICLMLLRLCMWKKKIFMCSVT